MKKIFSSFIALVCAMTMSAQITADVTLRLESQSGSSSEMYLFAGPYLATHPERGSLFVNASNPEDINIYAIDPVNSNRYSSFGNEVLENIPVGFITSKEALALQSYTIHFDVYTNTEVLKLKDLVTGDEVNITNGGSYTFVVTEMNEPSYVEGQYSAINDRFVINYVPAPVYSVTTNIDGWASYSSDVDLVAPAGLTVYAGTIVDEELILTSVDYIKANEGVIVKGEAGLTYTLTPGSGSDSYTNDLKPSSAWASHSGTIYCLHNEGVGTTAFYRYIGSDMPANKAYLQISTTPSSAPKRISMRFNQPTAIENVELEAVKAEKFIENGQVLIKRGEIIYNVQGQIVK